MKQTEETVNILAERRKSILDANSAEPQFIECEKASISGSVSQRACVYCGARVVLNPITDAYHIVHGPIGCAAYTWDIRGSLTSGSDLFRNSYSTDLRETDIIFGGAKKLSEAIDELAQAKHPKLIFVYATCIVGVIGDDVESVCRQAEEKYGIRCIPVKAPGFSGTKSDGYRLACNAIMELIRPAKGIPRAQGVNILGDYNLAGEVWAEKRLLEAIGIPVVATATGDASYESLMKMPSASLNIVQCAGSAAYLARKMEKEFGIPFHKVSFFGTGEITRSLLEVAAYFGPEYVRRAKAFTDEENAKAEEFLEQYRPLLKGKKAAIFVGGGFKAISLIKQFNELGMDTVMVGTQTGQPDEYVTIQTLVKEHTVVLDDATPAELEKFMTEKGADLLVGGVKERPLAYKLGVAFCDHNHERKHALAGYEGLRNFTKEVSASLNSPIWQYIKEG